MVLWMVINMIFEFKNTFFNYYSSNNIKDEVINCIDKVFSSYLQGDNLIWFESYSFAKSFFDTNAQIPDKIKKIFVEFSSHRQDIASIRNNISTVVFIAEENSRFCYKQSDKCFYVPITYFTTSIERCTFLSENLSDIDFYMCLSYYLIYKYDQYKHLRGVKLKCNYMPGGGSDCKTILERLAKDKKFTLAICDSDKNNLADSISPDKTAGGIQSMANKYMNSCIIGYYILNCREKENLIHPYFWDLYFNHNHSGISYLAANSDVCLAFINYTSKQGITNLGSFNLSQYSKKAISKKDVEKFSEKYLITQEYVENYKNFSTVSCNNINLLDHILPLIQDDYDNIVNYIFSWTCTLDKIIFR